MATSDRIAVMNKGRIEQVDAPYEVYVRPKTRFVAGFIGRTNFITGTRRGADVALDGFAVAVDRLGELPAGPEVMFSVPTAVPLSVRGPLAADQGSSRSQDHRPAHVPRRALGLSIRARWFGPAPAGRSPAVLGVRGGRARHARRGPRPDDPDPG